MKIWRPQSAGFLVGGAIILAVAAAGLFILNNFAYSTILHIGGGAYQVDLATIQSEREKGLSGRDSLGLNEGMLMVFPDDDNWKIWMKDMKFPIDIIWLDQSKKVVYIVKEASPQDGSDKVFMSRDKARYVLELSAGSVDKSGIRIGSSAVFSLDDTAEVK